MNKEKKIQLVKISTKKHLEIFIEIISQIFEKEFSDKNKFYGIFEKYEDFSELYLIKYDNEFVGTGHLIHFKNKVSVIDDIAVKKSARGKGIATFLMKSLLNNCYEKGQKEVYLFASEMALNTYKKLGFKDEEFWLHQFVITK